MLRVATICRVGVAVLIGFGATAWAVPDPTTENFTEVFTQGNVGGNLPTFRSDTVDGPTTVLPTTSHFLAVDESIVSPGSLDASGTADFGTLRSRVDLRGPSGLHVQSTASFHEQWVVNNPALTGTAGSMKLAFDLSGSVSVRSAADAVVPGSDWASVALGVSINDFGGLSGTDVLNHFQSLSDGLVATPGFAGSPTVTDPIAFTYGTPFWVTVDLTTHAVSDNTFLGAQFSPFFLFYGGGAIDKVTVDFANTAELTAIELPDTAGNGLTRVDGVTTANSYSPLLTEQLVPEPASIALLACGAVWLARRRERRSRS